MESNTESIFFYGQSTFVARSINLTDKTQNKKWKISNPANKIKKRGPKI